jgi:hypothetical protein
MPFVLPARQNASHVEGGVRVCEIGTVLAGRALETGEDRHPSPQGGPYGIEAQVTITPGYKSFVNLYLTGD